MRSLLRFFLLLLLLAYGTHAVEQVQHIHVSGDRHLCTTCTFGALPGEPAATFAEPLPPDLHLPGAKLLALRQPPPPALAPLDVSFSTSPPSA